MTDPSGYGVGAVAGDVRNHAIERNWSGRRALCGAGRIVVALDGKFDLQDSLACPDCAEKARTSDG